MKRWTETTTYGNGERYFLRKLRNSYRILTDTRNSYVFLKWNIEMRLRMNENVTLETRH